MTWLKFTRAVLMAALLLTFTLSTSQQLFAQTDSSSQEAAKAKETATGLEVQLHLLVASKSPGSEEEKVPAALDAVVKQLRATFPSRNYRLVATLLNRVKNGRKLNVRWVGGPLLASSAATTATPGFNELNIGGIKLIQDEAGRDAVEISNFYFGARIPVQITSVASNGASAPVVQYEQTGITTDITMREGEPTIVGTLNVGPAGDILIIVVSAKRATSK